MTDAKAVNIPIGAHFKLMAKKQDKKVLEAVHMKNIPYSNAVGIIMYMMVSTRPDITYALGLVSRFMSKPSREHWQAVQWLLRYLKGTTKLSYNIQIGGNVVSWKSNLQSVVALSTTEAEYISLTEAVKEGLWITGFVSELGFEHKIVTMDSLVSTNSVKGGVL
ncbi:secreted RxLR effector protein 161-like [Henckelia pumila]|uniref:secreted RxLR effector protein 161-like n=1 Tax=Henckelia pumila TaxID=405737 RepID=UPI003C6DCF5E